jgi:catechol 2,3-dioxygenase-like lactoylglutathione lyase family enzyme
MENLISRLLSNYETGKLNRRDLIKGLTILTAVGSTASAAGLNGSTLDHVALQVSDVKRSRDFYINVFGLVEDTRPRSNNSLRVDFPKGGFLTLQESTPAGNLDHIAIKLDNFDKDLVTGQLKGHGITPVDLPSTAQGGAGFHVLDPDGVKVQLR